MKKCKRCGSEINIEGHHINCKFMNNPNGFGEVVDLCKDNCHIPLHLIIQSILWKHIKEQDKYLVRKRIEEFTKYYVENYYKKDETSVKINLLERLIEEDKGIKFCHICERELDIEDKFCDGCGNDCLENNE
jgi:hypothetical protein